MIKLAVFDCNRSNREELKEIIVKYTVKSSTEFDVLWFFENITADKITKYSPSFQIALISLDMKESQKIGELIYHSNEDCRIVFYSAAPKELEPLLRVRPRGYYNKNENENCLFLKIDDIVTEIKHSNKLFCYENRTRIIIIPYRNILYFQSDLKYVNIFLNDGKQDRVYSKLSEIEPKLSSDFLRIHKSYLVNKKYICSINKSDKLIILTNGLSLPVSEAYYKTAISGISERK